MKKHMKKYMRKKYLILVTAVLLFSGCEDGGSSREYVEFEYPSYLTTMTTTTTVPVDTYSEYMETYTPTESETIDSNRFYYRGAMTANNGRNGINGVYADTMATAPKVGPIFGVTADTPMTTTAPPATESGTDNLSTETVTTELPDGEGEESSETVTATVQTTSGVLMDTIVSSPIISGAHTAGSVYSDTVFSNNVTAYTETVPKAVQDTMYSKTSATTTNGGNG